MLHPEGGFYSAEDAERAVDPARPDDKEEGSFYTWTKDEIDRLLESRDAAVFNFIYGVEGDGNAELDAHQKFVGLTNETIIIDVQPKNPCSGGSFPRGPTPAGTF